MKNKDDRDRIYRFDQIKDSIQNIMIALSMLPVLLLWVWNQKCGTHRVCSAQLLLVAIFVFLLLVLFAIMWLPNHW